MATGITEPTFVPAERLRRRAEERAAFDPARVDDLARALARVVEGEVRFDPAARALYAQDASNYHWPPLGVVTPRSRDDLARVVGVCRAFGAPLVARAGGTALAGQSCNHAVVVDVSRHLGGILDVDLARRTARVEPGVVCDDLVARVAPHGLTFGPKPATHDRCCFGGMISNNCGGMEAQIHGTAVNNVEAMDVVLYDGTPMALGWMSDDDFIRAGQRAGRQGEIYRALRSLRDRYAPLVRARYPRIPRRVSGYNLDQLIPGPDGRLNVARAVVGSEGTLVTMLDITLALVESPPERVVVAIGYTDLGAAGDAVKDLLPHAPTKLEGMDSILRDQICKKGGASAKFESLLPRGEAWLFVEVGGRTKDEARAAAERVAGAAKSRSRGGPTEIRVMTEGDDQAHVWKVREGGLGATAFVPGEPDTWPGFEDSAVAPERLGDYLRELRALLERHGMRASLYGHFGMGCVHCRLPFDLNSDHGVADFRRFMREAAELVVRHGGSISGEHGDGQSRAELLPIMFGEELVGGFREYKAIWDPLGKMNPGRIVDPAPLDAHLRLGAAYTPKPLDTHFRYPEDGGEVARATLRCVGVGKCRRESGHGDDDTMCPSYMVTREEQHSTRGRAHLLWEMQREGSVIPDGWHDEGIKEALDLCLACKGCKGDCPVNVDVATLKAEFFAHYYEKKRRPRHAYAFGMVDVWARVASLAPGAANLVTQLPGLRALAKLAAGVAQDTEIPALAPRTFRAMFRAHARGAPRPREANRVVLWADTFNDHFQPDTLMAAVRVLEAAGFDVAIPDERVCCGRPLYDFGMLDRAKRYLERAMRVMRPHVDAGTPIVVLEPSCASVFRDELPSLFPERWEAKALASRVVLLSELLEKSAPGFALPHLAGDALVQGHCHHKAVLSFEAEARTLDKTGLKWRRSDGGCCGMAGAFGYVKQTHEVGVACGERALLPKVRSADERAWIVADGFSCREQIRQRTDREALHLAHVLDIALDGGAPSGRPEAALVRRRARAVRRSMLRAALAGAAALALLALALTPRSARRRRV